MILLTLTSELSVIVDVLRRVVCSVLINNSPSNIFPIMPLAARFLQNCEAVFLDTASNY